MSQAGLLDIEASHPQIATSFTTDSGVAIPIANDLEILGDSTQGISSSGSGKTVTFTNTNASTIQIGVSRYSTDEEVTTGSESTNVVVPSSLNQKLGNQIANSLIIGGGSSENMKSTLAMTNGMLAIGYSGNTPIAATLTASTGMTIVNGEGSITLSASGGVAIDFAGDSGTAMPAANTINMIGGTGITTSATGAAVTFDLDTPVAVTSGGTGQSSYTDGQLLIGNTTGNTLAKGTLTAGAGISIVNASGSITISNSAGGFSWTEVTGTSQAMAIENGYVANNAGLVTLTLPATAAVGEAMQIIGKGAGKFKVAQNAGQTVHITSSSTTTGAGGSLTAIEQYASLEIICITANTDFVISDSMGNFTIV